MKVNINTLSHDQDGRHVHIWYKHLESFFSGTKLPMTLKLGMQHWLLACYQICSNDDSVLTLTYLSLVPFVFVWENV